MLIDSQPERKVGPQSYNYKELNSANTRDEIGSGFLPTTSPHRVSREELSLPCFQPCDTQSREAVMLC